VGLSVFCSVFHDVKPTCPLALVDDACHNVLTNLQSLKRWLRFEYGKWVAARSDARMAELTTTFKLSNQRQQCSGCCVVGPALYA
jgi:hypothetical protein